MGTAYSFIDVSASITGVGGAIDLGMGSANSEEGIVIAMGGAKNTMSIGADGEVMHSLHADKSGTITVNLQKTSPVNKKLSVMYNLQSQSSATWGNNVIVVRNKASGDITTARSVAFQKQPDNTNAKDGNTQAWVFDCGKIDQVLGEF
ncbi:TPA: phage protein [Enterobacter ludwigii]